MTTNYIYAREQIITNHSKEILKKEESITNKIVQAIANNYLGIQRDFNSTYFTKQYWEIYAPEQRGHKPRGEAYPWGEVGEKVLEGYLYSLAPKLFDNVSFLGTPFGHDVRFFTGSEFIHIDIKSTGPTDNQDEVVSSPNQVTGNGKINNDGCIYNDDIIVKGPRVNSVFRPELAPFYLINNKIIPIVTMYLKVVYKVIEPGNQPLDYIEVICVPNGIALFESPNYLQSCPGLFTPGKDEVHVKRKRVRIKLNPLSHINNWRCQRIYVDTEKSAICIQPRSTI